MGKLAKRVYRDPTDVARLEALALELASNAHVRILARGGGTMTGVVSEHPALQLFETLDGAEGMNAIVRLEHPNTRAPDEYLWLDDIERVERWDPL